MNYLNVFLTHLFKLAWLGLPCQNGQMRWTAKKTKDAFHRIRPNKTKSQNFVPVFRGGIQNRTYWLWYPSGWSQCGTVNHSNNLQSVQWTWLKWCKTMVCTQPILTTTMNVWRHRKGRALNPSYIPQCMAMRLHVGQYYVLFFKMMLTNCGVRVGNNPFRYKHGPCGCAESPAGSPSLLNTKTDEVETSYSSQS